MNTLKSYMLAIVGISSLVASLTLTIVRANNAEAPTVVSSTAHFNPNRTYVLSPANGGSQITCLVTEVNGAWLKCAGSTGLSWVNTNTMMLASDAR